MLHWTNKQEEYLERIRKIEKFLNNGKVVASKDIVSVLEQLIKPKDKVWIEGDNQKQANFLAKSLSQVDSQKVHGLHMIQSAIALPEHLDIFEKGIAEEVDFSFAGTQATRLAMMIENKQVKIGNIHTYNELYGRLVMDLIPNIALIAATKADKSGNLYTGDNTDNCSYSKSISTCCPIAD